MLENAASKNPTKENDEEYTSEVLSSGLNFKQHKRTVWVKC